MRKVFILMLGVLKIDKFRARWKKVEEVKRGRLGGVRESAAYSELVSNNSCREDNFLLREAKGGKTSQSPAWRQRLECCLSFAFKREHANCDDFWARHGRALVGSWCWQTVSKDYLHWWVAKSLAWDVQLDFSESFNNKCLASKCLVNVNREAFGTFIWAFKTHFCRAFKLFLPGFQSYFTP